MKWITIHEYVNKETGEITKILEEEAIIINKTTKHEKRTSILGVTTITNYYRKPKYKQQTIQYGINRKT